jgi:(1->4)-alpha-D-glucan 1-alpha-D-glucosylmutase
VTALTATIRLQLNKDFTLDQAAAQAPYLAALGISHVYASPITAAVPGSTHGYDVIDANEVNPELGGYAALLRFSNALRRQKLGLIVDFVPNHMAAHEKNPWWRDVLEYGQSSSLAGFFDIDWQDPDPGLAGKLLLPVLGDSPEHCLARGELRLDFDAEHAGLVCRYFDNAFPIAPQHYTEILDLAADGWKGLAPMFRNAERDSLLETGLLRGRLADRWRVSDPRERAALFVGYDPQSEVGRERLAALLAAQHYSLTHWRDAAERINWRRFFDINGLVALRMDRDAVFAAYHRLLLELYRDGIIDGVRLDHVDGMADPAAYCRQLRAALESAGRIAVGSPLQSPYLIVEKILENDEPLATDWGIDGSTGYDFMDQVSAVLHDSQGEADLDALWRARSGETRDFPAIGRDARREILERLFPKPLRTLVALLGGDDAAGADLRDATIALLAAGHRYRTYGDATGFSDQDRAVLAAARQRAQEAEPHLANALDTVIERLAGSAAARSRFQQLNATLTAKAVEDTSFYRYGRLLSRNEVGSDPARFALTPAAFHGLTARRGDTFPRALLATATHDHKRGEDHRARLAVLSEIAEDWEAFVARWSEQPAPPEGAMQVMLFQTLVGAWPPELTLDDAPGIARFAERVKGWLIKALREAKLKTAWDRPDEAYENRWTAYLDTLLDPVTGGYFLADLERFVARIAPAGALNSLAQTLLRMTAPGVPDLYQGTEFWDFTLVDPDNRRPVDFPARQRALQREADLAPLLGDWRDGRVKQALIAHTLALRNRLPALFLEGDYLQLEIRGPKQAHLLAFLRRQGNLAVLSVVPRLTAKLPRLDGRPLIAADAWQGTELDLPDWARDAQVQDALAGGETELTPSRLLADFPVALALLRLR